MEVSYSLRKIIMSALPIELIENIRITRELGGEKVPILVLQMGKVGSSSIYDGLKHSRILHGLPVYHVHHISRLGLSRQIDFYRSRNTYVRHHLTVGKILNEKYEAGQIKFTNIVTSVREPIGRRISAFFENYPQTYPELLNFKGDEFVERAKATLYKIFEEEASVIRDFGDNWFHDEICEPFGLDVFSGLEKIEDGCFGGANEKARLILLKMEQMNDCFELGTKWLLGKEISLGVRNVSDHKRYASDYQVIKGQLRLKESVVREILSSKLVNFFYADEKEALVRKWS